MAIVIPADGAILERVLDAAHSISSEGLSRHAYGQFDAARMRTAWGRRRRRRFALTEDGDVLASAMQYDLAAVLDQQPVRVCGIAQIRDVELEQYAITKKRLLAGLGAGAHANCTSS